MKVNDNLRETSVLKLIPAITLFLLHFSGPIFPQSDAYLLNDKEQQSVAQYIEKIDMSRMRDFPLHESPGPESAGMNIAAMARLKLIEMPDYKIFYDDVSKIVNLVSKEQLALFMNPPTGPTRTQENRQRKFNFGQLIYQHFNDDFDFLMVATQEPSNSNYHFEVKPHATGTGAGWGVDYSAQMGSDGELNSFIFLGGTDRFRDGPGTHEVMHAWAHSNKWESTYFFHAGYTNFGGILGGWKPNSLKSLGNDRYQIDTHKYNSTAMGGSVAANGWAKPFIPYSNFELYLAGLIGPSEIGHDLKRAMNFEWVNQKYGIFSASEIQTTTIEEYIAEFGERIPNHVDSPKNFKALYVVLSDEPITSEQWKTANDDVLWFQLTEDDGDSRRYNFWESTKGKATMSFRPIDYIRDQSVNDEGSASDWPALYNGITPKLELGIPFNNIGFFDVNDSTIYSCIRLYTNDYPTKHDGISRFGIALKIVSLPDATIQLIRSREFNKSGAFNENAERPDCSGKFETNTGVYTDLIQTDNGVLVTTWSLIDPIDLIFKLDTYENFEKFP